MSPINYTTNSTEFAQAPIATMPLTPDQTVQAVDLSYRVTTVVTRALPDSILNHYTGYGLIGQ